MPVVRGLWLENLMNATVTDIYKGICISALAKQAPALALNGAKIRTLSK